jgi:hypothetical protein
MSLDINPVNLAEIVIASTVADASSYGVPIDMYKDQICEVNGVSDTDLQRDSGATTSSLSVVTHGAGKIQAGGIPLNAIIIMAGMNSATSSSIITFTPRQTGKNKPYFGLIGVGETEDDRILAMGLYKCQLTNEPSYTFDGNKNAWMTSEMEFTALTKASVRQYYVLRTYENMAAWETNKPTDGAEMLSWFS